MVEIFAVSGAQSTPLRTVGDGIVISSPSKVYFGAAAPGIAYYEKSGADLKVTLLDGQEVLLRGFFVIGATGEFSALLDGGANGSVEVTGLVAPEPLVAGAETAAVVPVQTETAEATPVQANPAAEDGQELHAEIIPRDDSVALPAGDVVIAGGGVVDANAASMPSFGGIGLDRLLFGAAYVPVLYQFSKDDDAPAADGEAAGDVAGDGVPPLADDVAAMLLGQAGQEPGADAAAGQAFAAADLTDLDLWHSQGSDAISSLMDDLLLMAHAV